jgi:predicted glycogen debranching enzyme
MMARDFESLEALEWLEANGLGGYASGTVSGANSRRYHGVLVAALQPPVGRMVMLSKLDETLVQAGRRHPLADNRFPGTQPAYSSVALASFKRDLFPVTEFLVDGLRLRKTVAALHGENSTLIRYELLEGREAVLELQPFLAPRDFHALAHADPSLRWDERNFEAGCLRLRPYEGVPELFLRADGSAFIPEPAWYYRFQCQRELERGLDFEEDLFSYGHLTLTLQAGKPQDILVSIADPRGRDTSALWAAEESRRRALIPEGTSPLMRRLYLAAEQFLVRRGSGLGSVIAGYPWFADWGRDTMIALRGLCHTTGRLPESKSILKTFLGVLDQGMLPNRFPDDGSAPEYNTVDATLWLFVAIHDYWLRSKDDAFVLKECLPALLGVLDWHRKGTRYGIKVDVDGLLNAGQDGVQLTWMDAKVGDWVVTPRQGKAVEINALWYNALRITQALCEAGGDTGTAWSLRSEADRTRTAFEKTFWDPKAGACYDVIKDGVPDASLRPNQVFCLSLPFPLLEGARARSALKVLEAQLLTPRGLRSLAPGDPHYVPRYEGGVTQRDGAYHQGTVWSWLLGPYIEALVKVEGEAGKAKGRELLQAFAPHLEEACVGSVSEIFDAEAPHAPRGCFAQAWSVAELLRAGGDLLGLS